MNSAKDFPFMGCKVSTFHLFEVIRESRTPAMITVLYISTLGIITCLNVCGYKNLGTSNLILKIEKD
jgi:hypothetical protein